MYLSFTDTNILTAISLEEKCKLEVSTLPHHEKVASKYQVEYNFNSSKCHKWSISTENVFKQHEEVSKMQFHIFIIRNIRIRKVACNKHKRNI